MIYRPILPEGWSVEEQLEDSRKSIITFIRWGKVHPKAELSKIYVVFCQFNPYYKKEFSYKYSVRGGMNAKPMEELRHFNDLKLAEDYIIHLCNSTNQWLDEINSPEAAIEYERKVAVSVKMSQMPRI